MLTYTHFSLKSQFTDLFYKTTDIWYNKRFHNHFDLSPGLYDSATPDATCGAGTAYPSGARDFTPIFSVFRVVFCVVFRNWFFVYLSLFCWPLHCLSFDLRLLISSLVSSKFSLWHEFIYIYNMFWNCPDPLFFILFMFVQQQSKANLSINRRKCQCKREQDYYIV